MAPEMKTAEAQKTEQDQSVQNAVQQPEPEQKVAGYKEVEMPNGDIEMVTHMRTIGQMKIRAYKDNIPCINGDSMTKVQSWSPINPIIGKDEGIASRWFRYLK